MHNICYMDEPENVNRRRVMDDIERIAEVDGDGSYSGPMHWHDDLPVYKDREAAEAKIKELDKGWYDDHAVRYYDFSTAQPTKRIGELQAKVRETQDKCTAYARAHSVLTFKADYIGCGNCGSKLSRKHLHGDYCPVCRSDLRSETTQKKLREYGAKIDSLRDQIEAEKRKQTKARRVMWLIKYEYHS